MKRSCVGQQRGVDALGNLFGDAHAGGFAEVVDHFADGRGGRIDPINGAEQFGGGMMVDVDDELLFQIDQAGPVNIRTFNYEYSIIGAVNCGRDPDSIGARQLLVGMRRGVAHDYFDIFLERLQQPIETQRGTEAVAIGANMGSNRKAIFLLNKFNYLAKHYQIADFELRISD